MKSIALSTADDGPRPKATWKERIVSELIEYGITFLYLAVFFAAFTWYRRLVLAEYHITYLHYWISVIEALILAKVVMVGGLLHLGRRFEQPPLMVSTLCKTVVFTLFVGLFAVLEHMLGGLLDGKGAAAGLLELLRHGQDELLARCLVAFAFQELERALGKSRIRALLFRRGTARAGETVSQPQT